VLAFLTAPALFRKSFSALIQPSTTGPGTRDPAQTTRTLWQLKSTLDYSQIVNRTYIVRRLELNGRLCTACGLGAWSVLLSKASSWQVESGSSRYDASPCFVKPFSAQ